MSETVEVSLDIDAPPEAVYDLVADLTRMGEWSPENTGGRWLAGAAGAAPGARFRGHNRAGWQRWSTTCTIITAERGRELSWEVSGAGLPVSRWTYRLTPRDGGCTVTETFQDRRPGWYRPLAAALTGVHDRAEHNERGMRATLQRLKAVAEG